jgi:hypothetical protein
MGEWGIRIAKKLSFRHKSKEPEGTAAIVAHSWKPIGVIALAVFACVCVYYGVSFGLSYGRSALTVDRRPTPHKDDFQHRPELPTINREAKQDRIEPKLFSEPVPLPRPRPYVKPRPERRYAKHNHGTFEIEVPVQGDNDVRYKGKQRSYIRNGVRFIVYLKHCRDYLPSMPYVCYLDQDKREPLQAW